MVAPPSDQALDAVLALQLTVARAGEGLCEPTRLGWWQTDLVDELGGGDLLARLLPESHRWAALETVRQAAMAADRKARQAMARPGQVRTLFFWGFEIDETLDNRLAWHKRSAAAPPEERLETGITDRFSRRDLEELLRTPGPEVEYSIVPGGRQVKMDPATDLELRSRRLAAALLPLAEGYPMPFFRVDG